jgi:hypothetical protein
MSHSLKMRLDFLGSNTLGSEQSPQCGILTSHNPCYALHLKSGLGIATLIFTNATLEIIE